MAVANLIFSQIGERAVHFVHCDGTTLYVDQLMRVAPKISDHAFLRVNGDAIAIRVSARRGDDWPHRNASEFSDPLENVPHLSPFDCELMFVIDVLICAAAAAAEVWALGLHAMRRTFSKIDNLCLGELFLLAHDLGRDQFTLDSERNENGLAIFSPDAFAAECDVFDF